MTPASFVASFPSPPTNGLSIGPVRLHVYGLLIACSVAAAVWLTQRRWERLGGAPGAIAPLALWAVPAGLVGARIYHVATDYELYTHHPLRALEIWNGGLGIWGGIALGVVVGLLAARHAHLDRRALLDCVAPGLALAQAVGRWGNYFNQELYGRPTTLPWAVRIDPGNRPSPVGPTAVYAHASTFQPTFLYESLWDLAVVGLLLWAERRLHLRRGYLFALYVALYTFGRFFTEYLRIDFAHRFAGLRINDWTSIVVFSAAATILVWRGRPHPGDVVVGNPLSVGRPAEETDAATPDGPTTSGASH